MKPAQISIIAILAAALLVAGVIIAGCTQDTGSGSGPAGNSQQASPASTGTSSSLDNSGSQSGSSTGNSPAPGNVGSQTGTYAGNTSNGSRQYSGQNFLTNDTLLSAAADKLGVSEQDLKSALTPTNGRPNFTAAAQQLGVTQQQLRDALGFTAGGSHGSRSNATATPGSGQ